MHSGACLRPGHPGLRPGLALLPSAWPPTSWDIGSLPPRRRRGADSLSVLSSSLPEVDSHPGHPRIYVAPPSLGP